MTHLRPIQPIKSHLPRPGQRLDRQETRKDAGHEDGLNRWVVCGKDNGQGDQWSSGEKRHSEPPRIQTEAEDQEAEGTDTCVLLTCAPMRHLNGRVGAQGKETEDTEDQQDNASNEHGCVFRFATDHVGVLQDALQAVGMGVAHQWREGNGGDGRESHLTNPKNPLLALDIRYVEMYTI